MVEISAIRRPAIRQKKHYYGLFLTVSIYAGSILLFGYTGRDDSHITYFVGDMISRGIGVVNYNGESIEQSSSLLFSLILGLLTFLAPDGIIAADVGPVLSVLFAIIFVLILSKRLIASGTHWLAVVAICTQVPFVYWSLSGTENSLYALLLLCLITVYGNALRSLYFVALFSALITLVRPEGFIVVLCVAAGTEAFKKYLGHQARLAYVVFALGGVVAAFLFKTTLGLGLLPLPVYAKQNINIADRIAGGLNYFITTVLAHPVISIAATIAVLAFVYRALIKREKFDVEMVVSVTVVIATVSFAFLSGGDWMENGRFLIIGFLFAILLAFHLLRTEKHQLMLAGPLIIAAVYSGYDTARRDYGGIPALSGQDIFAQNYRPSIWEKYSRIHARDINFTDRFIRIVKDDPRDSIRVGSVQAGFVPYYLLQNVPKTIVFLDLVGLTTNQVHACESNWRSKKFYENFEQCGLSLPDYVFDLDDANFSRRQKLLSLGCDEIFSESLSFTAPAWKSELDTNQFLVRCDE